MIQYIYFVKCPNCEDEHFDFFDAAKSFAMGCLSKKPIITQTEINRNDFGECTDHCDLGTVWSWEDAVGNPDVKAEASVFTKDNLKDYNPDNDPEFADDDFFAVNNLEEDTHAKYAKPEGDKVRAFNNALKYAKKDNKPYVYGYENHTGKFFALEQPIKVFGEVFETEQEFKTKYKNCKLMFTAYPDKVFIEEACERKPVPEGMTIEQLVETMEENEDEVECAWCNDLFPKDMCKKEVNLGYLCPRCADGIMSRGETLTFKENNYWDFLDETFDGGVTDDNGPVSEPSASEDPNKTTSDAEPEECAEAFDRDPFDHHDSSYSDESSADAMADYIDSTKDAKYDAALDSLEEPLPDSKFTESFDPTKTVEFEYDDLTITVTGYQRDVDDWDEWEHTGSYTYAVYQDSVADTIWENFLTEEDVKDVPGGMETLEDNDAWFDFLDKHFDALVDKYYDKLRDYYEDDARDEFEDNYDGDDYYDDGPNPDDAYDAWRDERDGF